MFRKHRVHVQVKTTTQTSMGETVVWKPVVSRWARVVPIDARAQIVYLQIKKEVTHRIYFAKGAVTVSLGNNRINHKDKSYEIMDPPQDFGDETVVLVKEI